MEETTIEQTNETPETDTPETVVETPEAQEETTDLDGNEENATDCILALEEILDDKMNSGEHDYFASQIYHNLKKDLIVIQERVIEFLRTKTA